MPAPTPDEILDSARLAVASFFQGENLTKRTIRQDMTNLRALLNAYDARQETTVIKRNARLHA